MMMMVRDIPLVYTAGDLRIANQINSEFEGDARFDDEATRNWRKQNGRT
jgi:hypothetical protein